MNKHELNIRREDRYSDFRIIEGLKNMDNRVIGYIYEKYLDDVSKNIVIGDLLNEDDAKDIFQEALMIIHATVLKPNFDLRKPFSNFLHSICWRLLMKRLKKEYRFIKERDVDIENFSDEPNKLFMQYYPLSDAETSNEIRYSLLYKHFKLLKDDCKKVLKMFYSGFAYDRIAKEMGYKKGTFAKNKRYRCKEYLVKSIMEDDLYKAVKND